MSKISAKEVKDSIKGSNEALAEAPSWFKDVLQEHDDASLLDVKEWSDEEWRTSEEGGFMGTDFCHSAKSAVRIMNYILVPPKTARSRKMTKYDNESDNNKCADRSGTSKASISTQKYEEKEEAVVATEAIGSREKGEDYPSLVGIAVFSPQAESHRGLCHGGTHCALMDDAIGWMGFCVSGQVQPWSGYTVQVNTALKKGVPVGSVLKLESWVVRKEGSRKYWINARLSNAISGAVHCEAEGLFIANK